ncbi:MAG: hypothetical protein P4L84_13090 [Isosphaeraceae bacterium]|nr:hypothetical protein [Isosphaeraceae bacterium]
MPNPPNRRKSVRYASIENRAWLSWGAEDDSIPVPARVWDISHSGASVLVEQPPPSRPDQDSAWFRMEQPAPSDWAEVKVVAILPLTKKLLWWRGRVVGHLIRVKFVGSCPYDIFRTATYGDQLNGTSKDNMSSEYDGILWR